MGEKTYECYMECSNCGFQDDEQTMFNVPKGTSIRQFSKKTKCPECGCKGTLIGA